MDGLRSNTDNAFDDITTCRARIFTIQSATQPQDSRPSRPVCTMTVRAVENKHDLPMFGLDLTYSRRFCVCISNVCSAFCGIAVAILLPTTVQNFVAIGAISRVFERAVEVRVLVWRLRRTYVLFWYLFFVYRGVGSSSFVCCRPYNRLLLGFLEGYGPILWRCGANFGHAALC